jgi:hypothetical protein
MHRETFKPRPQRARMPALILLVASLAFLAACSGSTSTPTSSALLATAAAKLSTDTAFHFVMTEDHPGTPSGDQTDLRSATGDAVKPDKVSASAKVAAGALGVVDTSVIVVGANAWYKNPLTGQYESADQYANIGSFFNNSNNGLAAALTVGLQNVNAPTDGSANGVPSWKINATVSSDYLAAVTGGQVQGGQQIPVTIYIGKDDGQLHEVVIPGKLTTYDTDQTTRTVILSNFNESVTITPPPGS